MTTTHEPATPGREPGPSDRLDSWKAIAAHLGRGITTVQRWEQEEGLPVRRLPHAKKGSVFAYRSELDAWIEARASLASGRSLDKEERATLPPVEVTVPTSTVALRRSWRPLALVGVTLTVIALLLSWGEGRNSNTSAVRSASAATGAARPAIVPIANSADTERAPSLSPDGRWLSFSWSRTDGPAGVYVKAVPDGAPRLIWPFDPQTQTVFITKWSPAGDRIAFNSLEGPDTYGLHVIAPDGSQARRLTTMAGVGICWTADGSSVTFADRTSATEPFSLFSIDITTLTRSRLTRPSAGTFGDTACAWSSNGARLAFARFPTRYDADVFVLADADAPRLVARGGGGIGDLEWAPGDREIVFSNVPGLRRVAADGSTPSVAVAHIEGEISRPTFSRPSDSRAAALVYQVRSRRFETWKHDLARSQADAWAPELDAESEFPVISPDGQTLTFVRHGQVWTAGIDGSSPRQITFFDREDRPRIVTRPQWSPDGRRLAFSVPVGDQRDIYLVDRDGSRSFRLTSEPSLEDNASWSRDGAWVYFRSDRSGVNHIWKARANGGRPVQVTRGEGWQAAESHDGRTLYFTRGATQAGLWEMPTSGGPERLVLDDVTESRWTVTADGIAYTTAPGDGGGLVRRWRRGTREAETIATLPSAAGFGFSMSPDQKIVLWTREVAQRPDIMMATPWSSIGGQ